MWTPPDLHELKRLYAHMGLSPPRSATCCVSIHAAACVLVLVAGWQLPAFEASCMAVHHLLSSSNRHLASPTTQTIYTNLIRVNLFSLQRVRKLREITPAIKSSLPHSLYGYATLAIAKQYLCTFWRRMNACVKQNPVRACGNVVFHFSLTPALRSLCWCVAPWNAAFLRAW